jgi:hypothetical protein
MERIKKYDARFTAGGLLFTEFEFLSGILCQENFLSILQKERELNAYLNIPRESARQRVIQEIVLRYDTAGLAFWEQYVAWTDPEKRLGLFYICLMTYPIIKELHIEVALRKFATGSELNAVSVQMKLDELASSNDEVTSWSDSTIEKINSRYRGALLEAGLLKGEFLNAPHNIGDKFWSVFDQIGASWFNEFCFDNRNQL